MQTTATILPPRGHYGPTFQSRVFKRNLTPVQEKKPANSIMEFEMEILLSQNKSLKEEVKGLREQAQEYDTNRLRLKIKHQDEIDRLKTELNQAIEKYNNLVYLTKTNTLVAKEDRPNHFETQRLSMITTTVPTRFKSMKNNAFLPLIMEGVCEFYGITTEDMLRKKRPSAIYRHMFSFAAYELTTLPLQVIADMVKCDRTTAIYGKDIIKTKITGMGMCEDTYDKVFNMMQFLYAKLGLSEE